MANLNVVMINVTSRDDGLRVMDRLEKGTETGEINVEDVAMVYKTDKGKVKIQQTADATAGKGAVKGGGLGLLVGIVAAPLVPAIAVGAGIGALVGKARDRGQGCRQGWRARSARGDLRRAARARRGGGRRRRGVGGQDPRSGNL